MCGSLTHLRDKANFLQDEIFFTIALATYPSPEVQTPDHRNPSIFRSSILGITQG